MSKTMADKIFDKLEKRTARYNAKLRTRTAAATIAASQPGAADVARPPKEPDEKTYNGRVAKRLRDLRNKRRQSVEEFLTALNANGVSVNRSLVYAWENGSKMIHPNNYPAIAAALGCKTVRQFLPQE